MPLPVIADTFRVALNWVHPDLGTAENVIHVRQAGGDPTSVAGAIEAHLTSAMFDCTTSAAELESMDITALDGGGADPIRFPLTGVGGVASGQGIPQACGLVKLTTGLGGRSGRGRVFLPWLAENVNELGQVGDRATVTAAWTAFWQDMQSGAGGSDPADLVVASYTHVVARNVINAFCEVYSATQRRRLERLRS